MSAAHQRVASGARQGKELGKVTVDTVLGGMRGITVHFSAFFQV